jgi:hypothetical protein
VFLPFEDPLAPRRAVIVFLDLTAYGTRLDLGDSGILLQVPAELVFFDEMSGNHCKDEPAVVADIFPTVESVEEMSHHRVLSKFFECHAHLPVRIVFQQFYSR